MTTKKYPRKPKPRFSRRKIFLVALLALIASLIVLTTIEASKQQKLEQQDREKFAALESDMSELKLQLVKSTNIGEWKLEMGCEKPGIKFYTGEAGYCRIDVEPLDLNTNVSYEDIKKAVNEVGRIDSEGYNRVAEKSYIGFTFSSSGNVCGGYLVKATDEIVQSVSFSCGRPALHMYYPER